MNAQLEIMNNGHLDMREKLAAQRTILADERTFLAYIRTSVALSLAGGSIMHFFATNFVLLALAWFLILISLALFAWGAYRYIMLQKLVVKL